MLDNNISLYTLKPTATSAPTVSVTTTPVPYNQHYSPLRLKVTVSNKSAYFGKYHLPASLPINGYMEYYSFTYKANKIDNIYSISTDDNLSQQVNYDVSTIFDIDSVKFRSNESLSPSSFYLDFSGFNKVSYNTTNNTFSMYRTVYFNEDKYNQSVNPYEYIQGVRPSTVMMKNISWANNKNDKFLSYIGVGNLYKYLFNPGTLKNNVNDSDLLNIKSNFVNDTNMSSGTDDWKNDTVAGSGSCAPVSWEDPGKFIYFSGDDKMYFNGFKWLWMASKLDRNDSLLNDYYNNANNTAWISELVFHNADTAGRFNKNKYFLIYDTMPMQYQILNTILFQSNSIYVNPSGDLSSVIPFTFTTDGESIRKNIYFNLNINHPTQVLPNIQPVHYYFHTQNIPIYNENKALDMCASDFYFYNNGSNTYLTGPKLIQTNLYEMDLSTYLAKTTTNTIGQNTSLYLIPNKYSNIKGDKSISIDNRTIFPLKYKLNSDSSTNYVSYVNYETNVDIVNSKSYRTLKTYDGSINIFNISLNNENNPYIYNVNKYTHTCNLRFIDGYDSVSQTYLVVSSINPKLKIHTEYSTQRIYFNYNNNPYIISKTDSYFLKNPVTKYSEYNVDLKSVITNVFHQGPTNTIHNIHYVSKTGQYSYLEYVSYAVGTITNQDNGFYNAYIKIKLNESLLHSEPNCSYAGLYYWISNEGANAKVKVLNNEIIVKNINWWDSRNNGQDITINFAKVTEAPVQIINYKFGNNHVNTFANMKVNYNTAIISSNNNSIGYLLRTNTGESPTITLDRKVSRFTETVYINTGFYTDDYKVLDKSGIYIYKPTNISNVRNIQYFDDSNCLTESSIKFQGTDEPKSTLVNDGGMQLTLPNNPKSEDSSVTVYFNAYLLFNEDNCVNILPNSEVDNNLFAYYKKSVYNESTSTTLYIGNNDYNEIKLSNSYIFINDLTLYTKLINENINIDCIYNTMVKSGIYQPSIIPNYIFSDNTYQLSNVLCDNLNNNIVYNIYNLKSITFNSSLQPLKFNIFAYMQSVGDFDYGYIYYNSTIAPIDLDCTNTKYVGLSNSNNYINNRFLTMDNNITPSRDIVNETLKYVAKQYKCEYLNVPYESPVGIDVYFHPYYGESGIIHVPEEFDYTHVYSKDYENMFTRHYIYDYPINLNDSQLKNLYIRNIYYNIKNDTNTAIVINDVTYNTGDVIHISANNIQPLTVYDLIRLSQNRTASSFKYAVLTIFDTDKATRPDLLSAVINNIKVSSESKYQLQINTGWLNNDDKIEINLNRISNINDYDQKYNIINDYSLANINLSDIITINNKNLIYLEPVYLGFDNERFDIFNTTSTNDNDKYNFNWKNLLTFIETSTDCKLDPELYKQMQITSFSILNFVQSNCKILIDDDYNNNISTPDGNVIWDGTVKDTDELKNIYNLYLSDNKKLKTLDNRINNSTKFSYKIILSNYTFVLNCKLFKTANTPEKDGIDISFKFTLGNSDITTKAITLDKNNTLNFGTFYITDKQLAYIKNDQPGYLWFDPISNAPSDDYEVRITFWDENKKEIKSTAAGTIVIKNGIAKKWNMIEYINNNIDKDKKVNYISIYYIRTSGGENIEKYVLKPKV